MSYPTPYSRQYGTQYQDNANDLDFNPYAQAQQRHPTYDQGGLTHSNDYTTGDYRDYPNVPPTQSTNVAGAYRGANKELSSDQRSAFDSDDFTSSREKRSRRTRGFKLDDERAGLWTRGSRVGCISRFCCCTLWITIFLLVSIVLSLVLWARPPDISIGNVQVNSTGLQLTSGGLTINMGLPISVNNPNFFAVNFKKITADLTYPINNTDIGGGTSYNVDFPANSQKNFTFPFAIDYQQSLDPSDKVLVDLATKCGVIGNSPSDITVDYKLTLGIEIAFFTINPSFSSSFSFPCPSGAQGLAGMLGSAIGL